VDTTAPNQKRSAAKLVGDIVRYLRYGAAYRLGSGRRAATNPDIKRINLLAVEHCTNACEYCSTSSPFSAKKSHAAASFFPWLDLLERGGAQFETIAITGGEPFLHPDLFGLCDQLKERYPRKQIGTTTNFFWADEGRIRQFAPRLKSLQGILISAYPNVVAKLGGKERFNRLVKLLRILCPHTKVSVVDSSDFITWELHADKREVTKGCCTSDCYVLRADGKISHCPVAVGLEHRPEYFAIINQTREGLFDLRLGTDGFLPWVNKYPFDLCSHCTLWHGLRGPWRPIERNP
jgi:hypothetical protein